MQDSVEIYKVITANRFDDGAVVYMTRDGWSTAVADAFVQLAADIGVHPVSLAIAWVASHPAVTAPLIGARDLAQLEPAIASTEVPMDDELRARISALSPTPPPSTDRNEETSAHNYGNR